MAADSLTANKETTKAATKIVKSLASPPSRGREERGRQKLRKRHCRTDSNPSMQLYAFFAVASTAVFLEDRLFFLIQPVDVPALIQLADKGHVDEILWLGCLSFGFSSQNRFQPFEGWVLLPRQHRLIEEIFIALLEDITLYFAAEIFP